MTTQPVAAASSPRRRSRPEPRSSARVFVCRVEQLEDRFLLAQSSLRASDLAVGQDGTRNLGQPVALVAPAAERTPADASDPSDLEPTADTGGAGPAGTPPAMDEPPADQTTPATAETLPAVSQAAVIGTLAPSGPPSVFRVPVNPGDRSMVIGFSWTKPDFRTAASLYVLDSSAQVVWKYVLPSKPVAIDLEFANAGAANSTSLYLEIVPTSHAPASSAGRSSPYELHVDRFSQPRGWRHDSTFTGQSPIAVLGFGPSSNQPAPQPTSAQAGGAPASPGVALPLPATPPTPVGGIFALDAQNGPSAGVASAVADPNFLELMPVRADRSGGNARPALVGTPRPVDAAESDWFCTEPCLHLDRPVAIPRLSAWAVDQLLGTASDSAPLTAPLPALDGRARGSDPLRDATAGPVWMGEHATLPPTQDGLAIAGSRRTAGRAALPPVIAPVRPAARHPRAVRAIVYGAACWLVGLAAPELSATLGGALRGAGVLQRARQSDQTGAAV